MTTVLDVDAAFGADAVTGVLELRREGFEPLEEYTAMVQLGEVWPARFRRPVCDLRSAAQPDGGVHAVLWMVQSPWSSMTTGEAVALVWSWVDRHPSPRTGAEVEARAREVLSWSLVDVRTWLTRRRLAS